MNVGRDGPVGIATPYGPEGLGIISGGGKISPLVQTGLLYSGYWAIPGGNVAEAWR